MKVIIDRFEGNFAVCETENKEMMNIERSQLPEGAKEGDVLLMNSAGNIRIDAKETAERNHRKKEKYKPAHEGSVGVKISSPCPAYIIYEVIYKLSIMCLMGMLSALVNANNKSFVIMPV